MSSTKSKSSRPDKSFATPGSRIGTLLYSLDKLNSSSSEDVEQIRYTTAKIQYCIKEQEKVRRDVMSTNTCGVETLLATLESSRDTQTSLNVADCLLELLCVAKRASTLVSKGATQILLSALGSAAKQQPQSEDLLLILHQILAKIGPKDRKFGVKARLSGALPITLGMLRTNASNTAILHPVLQVLKVYATNSVNASYLGKSGAITCLFRIISLCGRKNNTVLKLTLESMCLLVKSKSNSARAIGQGGMPILVTLAYTWHQHDSRNKHLGIRKSILNVIKNITTLKSGKKAFNDADGTKILYGIAKDMVEGSAKDVESIVNVISVILRKCSQKNRLPLTTIKGPFKFELPDGAVRKEAEQNQNEVDDVIDDEDDQDDDVSSSDEHKEEDQESDADASDIQRHRRTAEDLRMYDHFFLEMTDYEEELHEPNDDFDDDDEDDENISFNTIHIPTGGTDVHKSQSSPGLEHGSPSMAGTLRENRLSLPELNQYGNNALTATPPVSPRMQNLATDINSMRLRDGDDAKSAGNEQQSVQQTRSRSAKKMNRSGSIDSPNPHQASPKHTPKHHRSQPQLRAAKSPPKMRKLSKSTTSIKSSERNSPSRNGPSRNSPARSSPSHNSPVRNGPARSSPARSSPARSSPARSSPSRNSQAKSSPKKKTKKSKLNSHGAPSSGGIDLLSASLNIAQIPVDTGGGIEEVRDYQTEQLLALVINLEDISPDEYSECMARTKRVLPFECIAHPEICGYSSPEYLSTVNDKKPKVQRDMVFQDIDRVIHPQTIIDRVVYDIDDIAAGCRSGRSSSRQRSATSSRFDPTNQKEDNCALNFNSLFESGNLRKAIQVRKYEYDLLLNPDINSNHHHQWFNFAVSNTRAGVRYRFNITNCEKLNSQFNFGMQPVVYSVREAMEGSPGWTRAGENVCYYKNNYSRSSVATGGQKGKSYYTAAFHLTFRHNNDIVYLAYHFPYTYTMMQVHLCKLEAGLGEWSGVYFRNQTLCETLGGNPLQVLTLTANPASLDRDGITEFRCRPYIFLSSRVHPGESNSSWVMKGALQFLMSQHPTAKILRKTYIFKIIPMLNPDGVINGSHRCSLSGEDLNRQWINPSPDVHPTIYHTKGLMQYLSLVDRVPMVYCDFHGHSRKKNVFLYGNSSSMSYLPADINAKEDTSYKTLPRILSQMAPAFSLSNCSFVVEKAKEGTARVVVWREIGVNRCYTMESTYCGLDQGPYKGYQITTQMLEEMGQNFCEALLRLVKPSPLHQQTRSSSSTGGVVYPYVMYDHEDSPDDDMLYMREPATHSSTSPSELDAAYRLSPDEEDQDFIDEDEDLEEDDNGGYGVLAAP